MRHVLASALGLWLACATGAPAQPTGPTENGPAGLTLTSALDPTTATKGVTTGPAATVPGQPPLITALDPATASCGSCGPTDRCISIDPAERSRYYFSAEYLLWWYNDNRLPPLVQAIPPQVVNNQTFQAGVATTLFPDHAALRYGAFSGFRLHGGMFFDDDKNFGIDGSFFLLPRRGDGFSIVSGGIPVIGRPFADTETRSLSFLQVASPGTASGAIGVNTSSELWGFDVNGRCQGLAFLSQYFDLIAGFRYLNLDERLGIDDSTTRLLDQSTVRSSDDFHTRNQFYGGQVGGHAHYCTNNWTLDAICKLALGDMHEEVDINGVTQANFAGLPPVTLPGALYAQARNIGNFSRDHTCFIPELTVNLGYQVTPGARVFIGYNLLWMSSVLRLGSVIDTVSDPAQIPFFKPATAENPKAAPVPFSFDRGATEFWVQGINFGFALRY